MSKKNRFIALALVLSTSCNYLKDSARYPGYQDSIHEKDIYSTDGNNTDSTDVIKIPDEKSIKFNYDKYVYESKVISLESTDRSQIGKIEKIFFAENRIFVFDRTITKSVFIFDSTGKFINKISVKDKNGSGMNRFFTVAYNYSMDRLCFFDDKEICFFYFDRWGKFLKREKTFFAFSDFSNVKGSNTFAYLTMYNQNAHIKKIYRNDLILGDSIYPVKKVLIRDSINLPQLKDKLYNLNNLCFSGRNLYFTPMFSNQVYLITQNDSILSRYRFVYPGKSINEVLKENSKIGLNKYLDLLSSGKYYGFCGTILEAGNNIFIEIEKGNKLGYFYNKKTGNILGGNPIVVRDKTGQNKLNFFKYPFCSNGDQFVSIFNQEDFKNYELSANNQVDTDEIVRLSKNTNPTLMFFKVKEF